MNRARKPRRRRRRAQMLRWSATLATIVVTAALADAAYVRTHAVDNNTFLDTFSFFEGPDPTHGFVDFVSRDEALKSGLLSLGQGIVRMAAETTDTTKPRRSIRVQSKGTPTATLEP